MIVPFYTELWVKFSVYYYKVVHLCLGRIYRYFAWFYVAARNKIVSRWDGCKNTSSWYKMLSAIWLELTLVQTNQSLRHEPFFLGLPIIIGREVAHIWSEPLVWFSLWHFYLTGIREPSVSQSVRNEWWPIFSTHFIFNSAWLPAGKLEITVHFHFLCSPKENETGPKWQGTVYLGLEVPAAARSKAP